MNPADVLDAFYIPQNEIDPHRLESEAGEMLLALASRVASGKHRSLLPARSNGLTSWFGIAPTDREARLLREEVRCWLGPPVSTRITDARTHEDPIAAAALRLAGGGSAVRIDVAPNWQATARRNVASLIDLWTIAPERSVDQPRPVGRVLRQFYEALLAGDRDGAESAMEEVRTRSLLSATNVRFLRVELLGALGTAEELRDDPTLRGISLLARPPAVTERLAAAANSLIIEPRLAAHDGADWPNMARELESSWPGLVTHPRQVTTLPTARCLAINVASGADPDDGLLQGLADRYPDDALLEVMRPSTTASPMPPSPAKPPLEIYYSGDYWAALEAIVEPDRADAAIALACAMNIGDSRAAVKALAIVDSLKETERNKVLATSVERTFYETLRERTSDSRAPSGWLDWLTGTWTDRPDLLADWAREWPRTASVIEEEAGPLAGELLDGLNDERRSRVRNGVPLFVEWLVAEGLPASAVGLATTVLEILLASDPGRVERQVALVMLEEILVAGPSSNEFAEIIAALRTQLPILGPRDASWLAQCLGLLLTLTSPDPDRRNAFFADARGASLSWSSRAEATDLTVLALLFRDAGLELVTPSREVGARVATGRPLRSVGIYSLLESGARVAANWIRELFPGVDVRLSSDHVNGPGLKNFVRGSDLVLVQTSHAKHAATNAIEAAAAAERDKVVLVHGRGASALLRAMLEWKERGYQS